MKNKTSKRILSVVLTLTMLASMSAFVFSANALDTSNILGQVYDWNFKGENGQEAFESFKESNFNMVSYDANGNSQVSYPGVNGDVDTNLAWNADKGLTYTSTGDGFIYPKPETPELINSYNQATAFIDFQTPSLYKTISDFEVTVGRNEDGTFPGVAFSKDEWNNYMCVRASDTEDANYGLVFEKYWNGRAQIKTYEPLENKALDPNNIVEPEGFAGGAEKIKYQISTYRNLNDKWNTRKNNEGNSVTISNAYVVVRVTAYDQDGIVTNYYDFKFSCEKGQWSDVKYFGKNENSYWGYSNFTPIASVYFSNDTGEKIENASIESIRLIYTDGTSDGACDHPEDANVIENEIPATSKYEGYSGDTYCANCGMLLDCGGFTPKTECDHLHTKIINQKEAVSCAEPGYTGDTYCDDCEQVIKQGEQITVPHKFGEWIEDEPATVTSEGKKHRECILCGQVENGTIDKLPPEKGDVNADGVITIDDAILVAQYDVGNAEIKDLTLADMNGDGVVTIHDALLIAQAAAK